MPLTDQVADLLGKLKAGDRRALARSITLVENGGTRGTALVSLLDPSQSATTVIGITGPPGAGKSTLVNSMTTNLLGHGHRIAVLLIDPSSPITGGAVLGDRIRFTNLPDSPDLYVRSLGSRGAPGGLTATIRDVIALLSVAGFDLVIIETVGAGQGDVIITSIADCTILAVPPGLGDSVQAIKAGIQEIADVLVVTKSDRPGASQLERQLRRVARRLGDDAPRPVISTSSNDGVGIDALTEAVLQTRSTTKTKDPS